MIVRCKLTELVFKPQWNGGTFVEYSPLRDHLEDVTHFRLDLLAISENWIDNTEITELIKSTKEYPIKSSTEEEKNMTIYLNFNGYTWGYNTISQLITIDNKDINI